MIGLNFFFFFLFRPHPNIAPVSHRAQLSSSTCRQQTRGGALSEHRPGNGHAVGGPVAPRMSARFESAAQSGRANLPFFFPVAPRRPEHSGAVMQALATASFCVFVRLHDLTSVNGHRGAGWVSKWHLAFFHPVSLGKTSLPRAAERCLLSQVSCLGDYEA